MIESWFQKSKSRMVCLEREAWADGLSLQQADEKYAVDKMHKSFAGLLLSHLSCADRVTSPQRHASK
jgi:hypothetical protein